jgi:hypothetical protein
MVNITIDKTMENRRKIIPISIVVLMAFLLAPQLQQANASSKSPYESGRDHGCDDAGISDVGDRYINQDEKGPSFHTNEFMRGYNNGFDDCSGTGSGGSGGNGGSGTSIEDDLRDVCINSLDWSADSCNSLINAGKNYVICMAINAIGLPAPC